MDLYLYSAFLVLMTTQSTLQYNFTFTQSHTHSYSASISCTLLFYEAQFGVQHLAQGHFGMQFFWEDWGSNCQPSGWRTTTLPPLPYIDSLCIRRGNSYISRKECVRWEASGQINWRRRPLDQATLPVRSGQGLQSLPEIRREDNISGLNEDQVVHAYKDLIN